MVMKDIKTNNFVIAITLKYFIREMKIFRFYNVKDNE